jgi:hypothetical protein
MGPRTRVSIGWLFTAIAAAVPDATAVLVDRQHKNLEAGSDLKLTM